ncbi:DUF559 domain-containing protein [Armatimonas sp.]|uniref:DUF559 domain-containing protein n=1 Tax=Armatimonas sp. TaxID=1872638 RepID=UPI00286A3C85|nr:DUF559 domain-containing protein [Armatimonas sp.]
MMKTKLKLRGGATTELHGWAHENRNAPTQAEELLWEALRNRQLEGLRFRCQHAYASFVLISTAPLTSVDGGYQGAKPPS